jgi:hypothetical protein
VLDFDGTDDPAHGEQEGVGYHGYYRQYMYHPLLVFGGDTGHLITAVLRPGRAHGSCFAVLVLRRLVRRLRRAWPQVAITLRADSGFAVPRLCAWCEAHGVQYTIGLIPNPTLDQRAAPLLAQAHATSARLGGGKVRLVDEGRYQAGSWARARRVVYKAEVLAKGPNTRFVVTTRRLAPPRAVRVVRGPRRTRELGEGPQERAPGRPAERPPLLGQRLSAAAACGRLLAARHPASPAGRHGGRHLPVRHPAAPLAQDRRPRAGTR